MDECHSSSESRAGNSPINGWYFILGSFQEYAYRETDKSLPEKMGTIRLYAKSWNLIIDWCRTWLTGASKILQLSLREGAMHGTGAFNVL